MREPRRDDENIIYVHPDIPELLGEMGAYESVKSPGLWEYPITTEAFAYVDFRPAQGGNQKGRRYAFQKEKLVEDVAKVPWLVEFKVRRDKLLHPDQKKLTPTNINESDKRQRDTEKNTRMNTPTTTTKVPQRRSHKTTPSPTPTTPPLTTETIKQYINPNVTDQEADIFLQLCHARHLNPFIGEVHLVKYGNAPATTIMGKDAFVRRAEQHPAFDGFEAGIIIKTDNGTIEHRNGSTLYTQKEELIGGWARVHRTDRNTLFYNEVSLTEYIQKKTDGTIQKFWREKPATMIRKVALVQTLRETFPSDLGNLYDSSEIGVEI